MKYTITKWTLKELYTAFKAGKLNLSPAYQRNFIWSTEDQQTLIDSINRKVPIPNFFILETGDGRYEMVDGQQRSRTIISFIDKGFKDFDGQYFSETAYPDFLKFQFPITIIHDIEGEEIHKFYALVNKTGIHLNKPEVRKADFYSTTLLKLVDDLAASRKLTSLKLFTENSLKRMNDKEFVSELIILLKDGHVEKKGLIDDYFKEDISNEIATGLKRKFNSIVDKIHQLNSVYPINKTRYKQRNDFYTLFDFIMNNSSSEEEELTYNYKLLVLISNDIKPTQEECEPLKEYARNCVTQSNSKLARENRLIFFQKLLANPKEKPNQIQADLMKFYGYKVKKLKKLPNYYTLNIKELEKQKGIEFLK
jgi:uncharacterized protein with ParB-like and HNH nuclease domain